jgi:high-affinity Fe2+/Pb2+ permease
VKRESDLSVLVSTISAIGMIAAFALVVGGIKLVRRKEDRGRGVLMLIAAAVLVGNVVLLTI